MTKEAHPSATDIGLPEATLIVPRRNFLIRALGFTAAGAAVSVPVVAMASAEDRLAHHLRGAEAAMREIFPDAAVKIVGNCPTPRDQDFYREALRRGDAGSACMMVVAARNPSLLP